MRVVAGAGVAPPWAAPFLVGPPDAVAVLVVGCVVEPVVCAPVGELATDTVLVPPPHPPSRAAVAARIASVEARERI